MPPTRTPAPRPAVGGGRSGLVASVVWVTGERKPQAERNRGRSGDSQNHGDSHQQRPRSRGVYTALPTVSAWALPPLGHDNAPPPRGQVEVTGRAREEGARDAPAQTSRHPPPGGIGRGGGTRPSSGQRRRTCMCHTCGLPFPRRMVLIACEWPYLRRTHSARPPLEGERGAMPNAVGVLAGNGVRARFGGALPSPEPRAPYSAAECPGVGRTGSAAASSGTTGAY